MTSARGTGVFALVLVSCLVSGCAAGTTHDVLASRTRTPADAAPAVDATCTTGIPVMAGYYYDKNDVQHGFVYSRGKFTTINDPNAPATGRDQGTAVYGISSDGTVGGSFTDSMGVQHGFIERAGKFTTINDPDAGKAPGQGTDVDGVNDLGVITGWFFGSNNVSHGFEDVGGKFTTFSDPNAGSKNEPGDYLEAPDLGTEMFAINDGGVLFGEYVDSKGVVHGAEEVAGRYVTIDDPSAAMSIGEGSAINFVNDLGVIVGEYLDGNGAYHGFLDQGGKFTAINDPDAGVGNAQGTEPQAIDNEGVIIGTYTDSKNVSYGFVDVGGKFVTINDPNAGAGGTTPIDTPFSLCP